MYCKAVDIKIQEGQTVLSEVEEKCIAGQILTYNEWGYPLDTYIINYPIK